MKNVYGFRSSARGRPLDRASVRPLSGFTLLQLLVVMGIIAVLAALLFGSLSSAREKGRKATCINNLRECYIAHVAYVHDYDGHLPPNQYVWGPYGVCPERSWDRMLISRTSYIADSQIAHCPSAAPERYEPGHVYGSFIRNPAGYPTFDRYIIDGGTSPENVILLVDSLRVSGSHPLKQIWFFAHDGFGCWQRVHIRHKNAAQTLLFDGHVDALRRGDFASGTYKPQLEFAWGHWYIWPNP